MKETFSFLALYNFYVVNRGTIVILNLSYECN